jgi:hypothetical protein
VDNRSSWATWIKSGAHNFQLRISRKPSEKLTGDSGYKIIFGSAPYLASGKVNGDTTKLPLYWGTTMFYQNLIWSAQLKDSSGYPVDGATVVLDLVKDDRSAANSDLIEIMTDKTGMAQGYSTIEKCFGRHKSSPFITYNGNFNYRWIVEYNTGSWVMYVKGNKASGIGSRSTVTISTAHICNQIMQR